VNSLPWPFIRVISGNGNSGFALWPLFGWRKKPGLYHREFLLWPLLYRNVSHLDEPQPTEGHGFLPFYTHESSPGVVSENYLWPFFATPTAPRRIDIMRRVISGRFLCRGAGTTTIATDGARSTRIR